MPPFEFAQEIYCLLISEFPMMGPVHVRHSSVKYFIQVPIGAEYEVIIEKIKTILSDYEFTIYHLFCSLEVTVWPNE